MSIETPQFSEMTIGQLRQYAAHLRLAVEKTATKAQIVEQIERKLDGRVVPEIATATSKLKPGFAKIRLLEDPTPDAANIPVYINHNGYQATLPRGVDIVVPLRVVRLLNDATVERRKQTLTANADGRETFRETSSRVPSFPYQILEMNPGPDQLTAFEETQQKIQGPRKRYRKLFGRWPRPRDLTRAIEQGLIKLDQEELIAPSESILSERED
jgi:hypothetical protein